MTTEPVSGRRAKSPSTTMMAARVDRFGGPDVIRYERVPRPDPGPGEVLVRVDITAARPLTELPALHRDAEAGHTSGKTVLIP
jgi:threonine dehydrogenase-like Zn-dependent dehydrogenase